MHCGTTVSEDCSKGEGRPVGSRAGWQVKESNEFRTELDDRCGTRETAEESCSVVPS